MADLRGKKVCPKCQTVQGVRTQQCQCGHKFKFEDKAAPAEAGKPQVRRKSVVVSVADQITASLALAGEVRELSLLCGGPEATSHLLDKVEALAGKVGGIASIKAILATVVPLPIKPVAVIQPVVAVQPVAVIQPVEPVVAVQPVEPVVAVQPVEPIKPAEPVAPVAPKAGRKRKAEPVQPPAEPVTATTEPEQATIPVNEQPVALPVETPAAAVA